MFVNDSTCINTAKRYTKITIPPIQGKRNNLFNYSTLTSKLDTLLENLKS